MIEFLFGSLASVAILLLAQGDKFIGLAACFRSSSVSLPHHSLT